MSAESAILRLRFHDMVPLADQLLELTEEGPVPPVGFLVL
jgi:hypothetical protein